LPNGERTRVHDRGAPPERNRGDDPADYVACRNPRAINAMKVLREKQEAEQ
jgi:hypothetical protein